MPTYGGTSDAFALLEQAAQAASNAFKQDPQAQALMARLTPGAKFFFVARSIPIWGEVITVDDPEEAQGIQEAREDGYVFTRCFSRVVPNGEMGSVHVSMIFMAVSDEEFNWAREHVWPLMPILETERAGKIGCLTKVPSKDTAAGYSFKFLAADSHEYGPIGHGDSVRFGRYSWRSDGSAHYVKVGWHELDRLYKKAYGVPSTDLSA